MKMHRSRILEVEVEVGCLWKDYLISPLWMRGGPLNRGSYVFLDKKRSIIRFVLFEWWESKVFSLGRNLFWPLTLSLSLPIVCHYWKVSLTQFGADCFVSWDWPTAVGVSRALSVQCQGSGQRQHGQQGNIQNTEFTLFDNWPNAMKGWCHILPFRRKCWF